MQRIFIVLAIVLFFVQPAFTQSLSLQQLHQELWSQADDLGIITSFLEKHNFKYISSDFYNNGKLVSFKKENPIEWVSFFYDDELEVCSELHYYTSKTHFFGLLDFVSNQTIMKPLKTHINEDGLLCRVFALVNSDNSKIVYEFKNGMIQSTDFYGFTIKLMDFIIYSEYYEKYINNGN